MAAITSSHPVQDLYTSIESLAYVIVQHYKSYHYQIRYHSICL